MKNTRQLTRDTLVLAPVGLPFAWRRPVLLAALMASVLAASQVHRSALPGLEPEPVRSEAADPRPKQQQQQHQQQHQQQQMLDQARMALAMAQARGLELERQVDTLNQRLRETQEALAFFRKTRDGKRQEIR